MIVVRTAEAAEQALTEGQLVCPRRGCGDTLRRWRYGRRRHVRSLGSQVIDVRPSGCVAADAKAPMCSCQRRYSHA